MANSADWTVEISSNMDGMGDSWMAIDAGQGGTVFQDCAIMRIFYDTLVANGAGEPVIALARTADGQPAAIFPFTRFRRAGLTWLECADQGVLDYCQPILSAELVTPQNAPDLLQTVAKALPKADLVYFNRLPRVLNGRLNPLVTLPDAGMLAFSSWSVNLGDGYDAHLASNTNSRFRSWLRRRIRQSEEAFTRHVDMKIGAEVDPAVFELVRTMRAEHFANDDHTDPLGDPGWSDFYRRMAVEEKGQLKSWVSTLSFDDQPAAVLMGLLRGDYAVCMILATNTRDFGQYSAGAQLNELTMKKLEQAGIKTVDWSIGDWDYKRRMGAERMALYDLLLPKSFAGRAYYAFWRMKTRMRHWRHREILQRIRALFMRQRTS